MVPMTEELELVIKKSREIAASNNTGFINYDHLFVAMLYVDCLAKQYISHIKVEEWDQQIQSTYEKVTGISEQSDLPLTLDAERVIRHSYLFARIGRHNPADSRHLLLAILSYNNPVAESFQKTGVIFEDLSKQIFKIPISKTPPHIDLLRIRPYSTFEKFFMSKKAVEKKIIALHQQAYALYEFEKFNECIKTCETGLSLSSSVDAFSLLMAYANIGQRNFAKALPLFIKIAEKYPDDSNVLIGLSHVYDEMGDFAKGEVILNALIEKLPEDPTIINNKAFNLACQGKYIEAVALYERCIALAPTYAYAWNNLGFAKHKLGSAQEALQLINKSLEFDAGNSYAYKNKGIVYMETGDKQNAMNNFDLALKYGYTKKYGNEVLELKEKLRIKPGS